MKNNRGLTLVELIAVIALVGIISALLISVLINGIHASTRNTENQRIQQEANYIVEVIRNQYLKLDVSTIDLEINNDNRFLKMNDEIISEGYIYCTLPECPALQEISIRRDDDFDLEMQLIKNASITYKIETTLSKLR